MEGQEDSIRSQEEDIFGAIERLHLRAEGSYKRSCNDYGMGHYRIQGPPWNPPSLDGKPCC